MMCAVCNKGADAESDEMSSEAREDEDRAAWIAADNAAADAKAMPGSASKGMPGGGRPSKRKR